MPPEDDLERFKKERVRAMELCRGETDPIVSGLFKTLCCCLIVCWFSQSIFTIVRQLSSLKVVHLHFGCPDRKLAVLIVN